MVYVPCTFQQREDYVAAFMAKAQDLRINKGREYARVGNRKLEELAVDSNQNFEEVAKRLGMTPEQCLMVYFMKAICSLEHWIRGGEMSSGESIDSRLMDIINYALILHSMESAKRDKVKIEVENVTESCGYAGDAVVIKSEEDGCCCQNDLLKEIQAQTESHKISPKHNEKTAKMPSGERLLSQNEMDALLGPLPCCKDEKKQPELLYSEPVLKLLKKLNDEEPMTMADRALLERLCFALEIEKQNVQKKKKIDVDKAVELGKEIVSACASMGDEDWYDDEECDCYGEEETWVCRDCGHLNINSNLFCGGCGDGRIDRWKDNCGCGCQIPEEDIPVDITEVSASKIEKLKVDCLLWECPTCKVLNAPEADSCSKCNSYFGDRPIEVKRSDPKLATPIKEELKVVDGKIGWICPKCKKNNVWNEGVCEECGTNRR